MRDGLNLLLAYVPGIDLRRVAEGAAPFVQRLLDTHGSANFTSICANENLISLLSGSPPRTHGYWGPKLRANAGPTGAIAGLVDRLPDTLTSGAQCLAHFMTGPIDLATMPPRRRRQFDWIRFNVKHMRQPDKKLREIATPTLLTCYGPDEARFIYCDEERKLGSLLDRSATGRLALEIVDLHLLDYLQHWNMHDTARIERAYATIDRFLEDLHARCVRAGIRMALVSDHGQEPVSEVVDPLGILSEAGIDPASFSYFAENVRFTLWFRSDAARRRITDAIAAVPCVEMLTFDELEARGIHLPDRGNGDAIVFARPGITFFPNDFDQPLSRFYLGLAHGEQNARITRPWHQGEHGYLSGAPCERGFLVVADHGLRHPSEPVSLFDVAPSMLALADRPIMPTMIGRNIFAHPED